MWVLNDREIQKAKTSSIESTDANEDLRFIYIRRCAEGSQSNEQSAR